jgi:PKD repeat protein
MTAATVEPSEPTPSCGFSPTGSVWYAFTPATTGSFTMTASTSGGFTFVIEYAAYLGSALGSLTQTACHYGNPFTFHANAGTPIYIQVANAGGAGQPIQVQFDVAPQPVANFSFFPFDPSIFDTVQFFDDSFDPAGAGIQSEAWSFGDGTTATGCCPSHRYSADGNYSVGLAVTTFDGRTASTSQVVQVRTHDVAITKFTVPTSASPGQTRQITVGISDTRYPETVQVQLFKSNTSGGFDLVGTLTQSVPVKSGQSTRPFAFSYTFTKSDATVGKVTFETTATILGGRDAVPADNTAIAPPTTVH